MVFLVILVFQVSLAIPVMVRVVLVDIPATVNQALADIQATELLVFQVILVMELPALVDIQVMVNDEEEDSIEFSFNSAWAPPTEAFLYWAQQDGRVSYSLKYYEPGMGFVGEASYDGDTYDDDCVQYENDPARFEELAADEWGWEPDEDPEPLTEWYTQGAREKGLME